MPEIFIASSQPALWEDFMTALEKTAGVRIGIKATGAEIVQAAREKNPLAVILDRKIKDMSGAELARQLLSVNAMIHVAWVSELPDHEFHESTEGLGILMKLSPQPDVNEARLLAARLRQISGAI